MIACVSGGVFCGKEKICENAPERLFLSHSPGGVTALLRSPQTKSPATQARVYQPGLLN